MEEIASPSAGGFAHDPSPLVESVFQRIHDERMSGLPFLNAALSVEAVGFSPRQPCWIGALITPWLVNLVLLPRTGQGWETLNEGTRKVWQFPSGAYDFISSCDPELGPYQMCNLVAPVTALADQASARAVATTALQRLFEPPPRQAAEAPPRAPRDGRYRWQSNPAPKDRRLSRRRFLKLDLLER